MRRADGLGTAGSRELERARNAFCYYRFFYSLIVFFSRVVLEKPSSVLKMSSFREVFG